MEDDEDNDSFHFESDESNEEVIIDKDNINKFKAVNIISHINELMSEIEIIQYFKNDSKNVIDLLVELPDLLDCSITGFEATINNNKIISKIFEKEKAEEKYNDFIITDKYDFVFINDKIDEMVSLGNIQPNEEVKLKTYYIGNIKCKDLSYQASSPGIFPKFVIEDIKNDREPRIINRYSQIVKRNIYLNTFSKITRLVIQGNSNSKNITKKYGNNYKSAEIEIFEYSDENDPKIILFRTEKMNEDILYNQYDPNKKLNYFLVQTTYKSPKINIEKKFENQIDENGDIIYTSLLENEEKIENPSCYIFLIELNGSMAGNNIESCKKALLLFLQSLTQGNFFQIIGFGHDIEYFSEEPLLYNKINVKNYMDNIKALEACKFGHNLYDSLKDIFENPIYDKFNLTKHIFLISSGYIKQSEEIFKLINCYSHKFILYSLKIVGSNESIFLKKCAELGNGNSFFMNSLNMNKIIIEALECAQKKKKMFFCFDNNYKTHTYLEDKFQQISGINDYIRYGFILKKEKINFITISITKNKGCKDKGMKLISSKEKNNFIKFPYGNKLGKIIINNYLKSGLSTDKKTLIKLSKEYSILTSSTIFYGEMHNEKALKRIEETNKKKEIKASNNKNEENANKISNDNDLELCNFGYSKKDKNEGNGFFSNLFSKNKIIKKNVYKFSGHFNKYDLRPEVEDGCYCEITKTGDLKVHVEGSNIGPSKAERVLEKINKQKEQKENKKPIKKKVHKPIKQVQVPMRNINKNGLDFDELILNQDILEGNWEKNEKTKMIIDEERNIYENIKKISENKGIKEENGFITLLVLYYIFNKNQTKIDELKFIIKKAKVYVKKLYGFEYEDIIKEI